MTWQQTIDEERFEAREEGREEGRREGRAEGREEGRREGRMAGITEGAHDAKIETARNLLQMNLTVEQISSATQLPLAEVQALQNT